jgi:hypothetical protein
MGYFSSLWQRIRFTHFNILQMKNTNVSRSEIIAEILNNMRLDSNLPNSVKNVFLETTSISSKLIADLLSEIVQKYYYEQFINIVRLVVAFEHELEKNPNAMLQASFAAWAKGFPEECERWSKRLIAMAPNHPAGYLRLGLSCLTSQKFEESFRALSTGMQRTNNDPSLIGWFLLSQRMATGPREVAFEKFGKRFRYRLSCFNTQAAESDAAHLGGRFTEESELEFLAGALGGCKSFAEVGALTGNHTVFLASIFQPEKYLVVDADERSIGETSANVELNRENYPQTVFSFVESALAGTGGDEVQIGTKKVLTRALEDLLPGDVDFLKIDIDGMEGALLHPLVRFLRGKNIRIFIEVESPFLEGYEREMSLIGYRVTHRTDHGNYLNLFFQRAD